MRTPNVFGSQGGCPWYTTDDLFYQGAWTPRPLPGRVIASTHVRVLTSRRGAMLAGTLQTWITRHIAVRQRLERICTSYLLFLMVVTTKHSLEEAARFSRLHKSLFSKMGSWPLSVIDRHFAISGTIVERSWATENTLRCTPKSWGLLYFVLHGVVLSSNIPCR